MRNNCTTPLLKEVEKTTSNDKLDELKECKNDREYHVYVLFLKVLQLVKKVVYNFDILELFKQVKLNIHLLDVVKQVPLMLNF